jgi:hypothetical protein
MAILQFWETFFSVEMILGHDLVALQSLPIQKEKKGLIHLLSRNSGCYKERWHKK